ncbi:MAG: type II CAAX endopeptidase family protein [Nitrospirota bacterium]
MKKYFQAPWNTKDIIITILVVIGLLGISLYAMDVFNVKEFIEGSKSRGLWLLLVFVFQWVLIAAPILVLTGIKYKFSFKNFGINKVSVWNIIKLVASGYLLFLGISFIVYLLTLYTDIRIPGYQVQERILPLFGDNVLALIISGVLIIAVAPVIEEVFFRGFLLRSLSNKMGIFYGSILTALIFALLHLQPSSIIPVFILGLIINSLVIKSKSIIPAIAFHAFNNAVAFTIELLILKEVVKIEEIV